MRIGAIADVHGNLVALERVLEDLPPVDRVVCAGDVVGYGPWPGECVDRLREESIPTVCGNHDRAVRSGTGFRSGGMAAAGAEYAREHCTAAHLEWLQSLPDERRACDDRVTVVHGHPDDPDRYTYPDLYSPALLDDEDVLVMGHTHVQGYEQFEDGIVVNPGSVGQPRDGDPGAAYSVVDLDRRTVTEHRVAYDVERVQRAVRAAGLPAAVGERLEKGR